MDLVIRPDKCVTIVFDGKKIIINHRIELTDAWTRSISEGATKFLCATIATSHQSTSSTAKKQLEENFSLALKSIDSRPIRGEYKVWIFRNYIYVLPSSRFLLTVDLISDNGIRSIQSTATKFEVAQTSQKCNASDPFPPIGPQLSTSSN